MPRPSDQQCSDADFGTGNFDATPSTDILTEDVDQAILHFAAAVREENKPIIIRTVLFLNEVLISTVWRTKRYREEEENLYGVPSGMSGRGLGGPPAGLSHLSQPQRGAPSLTQWVDALESLTVAGLPTALRYLRDLYQSATSWTQADRRCSLAVLNLIFFILVLCRQTQRRVAAMRQCYQCQVHQQQQCASAAVSPSSNIAPFLLEDSHKTFSVYGIGAEGHVLDLVDGRIASLYQAQQTIVLPYLCFIAWNAEAQLRTVKVHASVCIKGMPSLSELPQVPLYLSEHDGWIWVWVTVTLYSTLSLRNTLDAQPVAMSTIHASASATVPSSPRQVRASVMAASTGSLPPATPTHSSGLNVNTLMESGHNSSSYPSLSARRNNALFPSTTAAAAEAVPVSPVSSAHRGINGGKKGVAGSVDEFLNGSGGCALRSTQPVRSGVVRLLMQMSAHDGGELYMHKMVSVMLSSFELVLQHWTRGQPVLGDLLREWTQRIVHSRLSSHVFSASRLATFFDRVQSGSLEELTRLVVMLDDVVLHASFLFLTSTQPFLRLHQLLEQLVPLEVALLLIYQLHPEAHRSAVENEEDGETMGDLRYPEEADDVYSSGVRSRWAERRRTRKNEACADAVLQYCTAVSQLLAHAAELLLEPYTQRANAFNALQLPQRLCCAMLKNTMMFMAAEIMLHEEFWMSLRGCGVANGVGGGAGGRDGGRGGGSVMRKQWRWWAVWANTAHFVCVTGGRFGEPEEADVDLLYHQRRRDVFYVQANSLALEDMYALLQMVVATDVQQSLTPRRTLSLIFQRLRTFFLRLHEEHLAAISLNVVSPFSALREDTFNAFAQLLEHYVAVTAMGDGPSQTLSTSPNRANVLRGAVLPKVLPPATPCTLQESLFVPFTPPHRSLWLLAVSYLRLAIIDSSTNKDDDTASPSPANEEELQQTRNAKPPDHRCVPSTHNFVCATPFVTLFYLRDRSYESSEDWMQQPNKWQKNILSRNGTEVPQLRDSAHLFRCYRGEVQQTEDAARELLLLASIRLLTAALQAASRARLVEEPERLNRSVSSSTNLISSQRGVESQAFVYVTAFSRYLCMLKDISSPCLLFLLRSIREELRSCKGREGSAHHSNASAFTGEGNNWIGEQDLLDARAFQWEVSLYSV